LLNFNLIKNDLNINLLGRGVYNESNLPNIFLKKVKSQLDEGAFKNNFYTEDTVNFFTSTSNKHVLDNILSEYRFVKNFYNKNTTKSVNNLDNSLDLWTLSRNNNISRVYPNLNRTLLSGNLFLSNKEGEGSFNTNLVSIKNPIWDGLDRYFLNISRKHTQDLAKLNTLLESNNHFNGNKHLFFKSFFLKNSDHSDMNRWLKRG